MPYRIPAINEAAIEDEREVAAFAEGLRRQRTTVVRRVLGVIMLNLVALVVASAWMTSGPPRYTLASTESCTEDTCLCWLEEHHTWARFSCTPMPAGTCFKSKGTCP
jgi:hypothetical protein